MLHTRFKGYKPIGPGEENFEVILPHMGMAAILVI